MSASTSESIPSGRPSFSEASQPASPLPLFEHHLRVLNDSYLSFFLERKRIEEVYVESLLKLHRKAKAFDTFLDDRTELNTARKAWSEVRDNLEREAQTRQAFLSTLTIDVVNSLISLKEIQERTRKRIKEDLKESGNAYSDYSESTLPRLKRSYLRRCQEVEDYKAAAAAAPPPVFANPVDQGNASFSNPRPTPNLPSKPLVTSPHPLRPLDRRPSGSGPTSRNRSPPSGSTFSEFAHQGKHLKNQLMTFLDKSGTVKETLGRSDNSALRGIRAKREAEEADREYRKGVHWLETLRLNRAKILEGAYKSLELFVYDYSTAVKDVLVKYSDNMTATSTTQTQLASHARSVVDRVNPEVDVNALKQIIPRALATAIPQPTLYYNYYVGECSDLIFGVSLVDYATARNLAEHEVPKIVRICIQEIDQRGLESEGIYRVSGRHAIVHELQQKIERNESAFKFNSTTDDVYAVASFLKMYLRELPEPLFKFALQDRIEYTEDRADHQLTNFALLRSKIRRLPPVHRATLRAVVEHLARIVALAEKNKMDVRNLAIVFGAMIFGEDEIPKGGDLLSVQSWRDTLMEDLIGNVNVIFDEPPPPSTSPPLPDAPMGEQAPVYPYGSAHTRMVNLPPPLSSRPNEDFTPKLPPRPNNSIHPSSRANPVSPSRSTAEPPPTPSWPPSLHEENITDLPTEVIQVYGDTAIPDSPGGSSHSPRSGRSMHVKSPSEPPPPQ